MSGKRRNCSVGLVMRRSRTIRRPDNGVAGGTLRNGLVWLMQAGANSDTKRAYVRVNIKKQKSANLV